MKQLQSITIITLLIAAIFQQVVGQDQKLTVAGKLIDKLGYPIAEAKVILSSDFVNINSDRPDTAYTDENGEFEKEILVNPFAWGIRYIVLKDGYKTEVGYGEIDPQLKILNFGEIILENTVIIKVNVFGTVKDSAGQPIPQALVRLSADDTLGIVNNLSDTVSTDKEGKFSIDMRVEDDVAEINYIVAKRGYRSVIGSGKIENDTVDLGTIVLYKPVGKKIIVIGHVVDSVSGDPVVDAEIILYPYPMFIVQPDTTYTDKNGDFAEDVLFSEVNVFPAQLAYIIQKQGYKTVEGKKQITGWILDTVNIGTISLVKDGTPIKCITTFGLNNMPNNISLYTLKGQLLYSGAEFNFKNLHIPGVSRNQPVIACYKFNNKVLYRRKIIRIR